MNTNGINIELRPGIKVVKESYGNREVIWIEEDTVVPNNPRFTRSVMAIAFTLILFLSLVLLSSESDIKDGASKDKIEYIKHKPKGGKKL